MIKANKKIIIFIAFLSIICLSGSVFAVSIENPLKGRGINSIPDLLKKIAEEVGKIVASLAVLMIIVAGILFLFSAGNPNMLGNAKLALTYAIIGAAVALAASGIAELIKRIIGAP